MDVADTIRRAAGRPALVLVWVVVLVLVVDFAVKLYGAEIGPLGGDLGIPRLATLLWDGIVIGLAIGLAGVGLSMTYSILGFANFSHGDYLTAGAYAGWAVAFVLAGLGSADLGNLVLIGTGPVEPGDLGINVTVTPFVVLAGLVVAIVVTILVSLALDRLVYRPMRDEGAISLLIASIGIALAVRYLIVFVFSGSTRGLTANTRRLTFAGIEGRLALVDSRETMVAARAGDPGGGFYYEIPLVRVGDFSAELLTITTHEVTLVVVSVAMMYGLHVLLQRTKLGTSMRAMADNEDLARVTGIPTERVIRDTWVIGGGMAGAAGYLVALDSGTLTTTLGWTLLLLIFAAVILGGIGSIYGAMAGGVVIGLTSRLALVWIPTDFAIAAAFAIMILVLLFKPSGIFSGVTTA